MILVLGLFSRIAWLGHSIHFFLTESFSLLIRLAFIKSKLWSDVLQWTTNAFKVLLSSIYLQGSYFFFFKFLDISPMYTTMHFVQSILYIHASVLLLLLSHLVLTISLIVLEAVLMKFRLRMVKLFFIVVYRVDS